MIRDVKIKPLIQQPHFSLQPLVRSATPQVSGELL
jgi:hypothetical protein